MKLNATRKQKLEPLLVGGALLLLALLLYNLREALTPPVLIFLIVMLLAPLRDLRAAALILGLGIAAFAFWFVQVTRHILTPFIISITLAYLFDPLVEAMQRRRFPRWLSVLLIEIFVLIALTLLLILLVPQIIREFRDLVAISVDYSNRVADWFEGDGVEMLSRINIDSDRVQEFLLNELPGRLQTIVQTFFKSAVNITNAISAAIGQMLNFILVPFLFFYLLMDFNKIKTWTRSLLADRGIARSLIQVDRVISGFFRGQLIVCLIVATMTSLGLWIMGIRYSLLLGLMAGALNIIPYIGLLITLLFGLIVGLFSPSPFLTCIKIVAVIEIVQVLEGSLLSPKIVGDRVGLHPVWVIFAILIFSHFFGLVGLFVAVPTAAVVRIFISDRLNLYRAKRVETQQ